MAERQINPEVIFTSFDRYTRFVVNVNQEKLGQFLQQELGMSQEQLSKLNIRFYGVGTTQQGTGYIRVGQFNPGGRTEKDSALIYIGSLTGVAIEYESEIIKTKSTERLWGWTREVGLELFSSRWPDYLNNVLQDRAQKLMRMILRRKIERAILKTIAHESAHALVIGKAKDMEEEEIIVREIVEKINFPKWDGVIDFRFKTPEELRSSQ